VHLHHMRGVLVRGLKHSVLSPWVMCATFLVGVLLTFLDPGERPYSDGRNAPPQSDCGMLPRP
jgi:hypothetical protein